MANRQLIDLLEQDGALSREQWKKLLGSWDTGDGGYAREKAQAISRAHFGNHVYVRGLIEFSSYCKNNCYYCGLRKSNRKAQRYRLTVDEILRCCETGYGLGFRTFVLQGGEDLYYSDDKIVDIIKAIKSHYPDCALTLSIGEKGKNAYRRYFDAGADRYLLRHETADSGHYAKLHPPEMSLETRKQCLWDLKEIGFQTGCGFMVGSPFQTVETLAEDLLFIRELEPQMVGIGPFIPHRDTPFGNETAGTPKLTLFLLSLIRIMLKSVLLPATTALGTIYPKGREMGILAGANVVMPNLSPVEVRKKYLLYDNKICTGDEAAECKVCLENQMKGIGYEIVTDRGDWKPIMNYE